LVLPMPEHEKSPLRVFYLEDNPLIVMHVAQIIEDLGHVCVGTAASFAEFKDSYERSACDVVLIDIDLADGRTGPQAARWLKQKGMTSVFVTGQELIAAETPDLVAAVVTKPVEAQSLERAIAKCIAAKVRRAGQ
jgi:DNA-binding LytR/AlgR family response regulator